MLAETTTDECDDHSSISTISTADAWYEKALIFHRSQFSVINLEREKEREMIVCQDVINGTPKQCAFAGRALGTTQLDISFMGIPSQVGVPK